MLFGTFYMRSSTVNLISLSVSAFESVQMPARESENGENTKTRSLGTTGTSPILRLTALMPALPLHPEAPKIGVICRVKARAHRAAHRAKTLDIRADWLVVNSQQRSTARVAQAEMNVRMRSKVRLAVLAVGKLR